MSEQNIKLKSLRITEDFLSETLTGKIELKVDGNAISFKLTQSDLKAVVEAVAGTLVRVATRNAEALKDSVLSSMNILEAPKAEEV